MFQKKHPKMGFRKVVSTGFQSSWQLLFLWWRGHRATFSNQTHRCGCPLSNVGGKVLPVLSWARWAPGTSFLPYSRRDTHLIKNLISWSQWQNWHKPHRAGVVARRVVPHEMRWGNVTSVKEGRAPFPSHSQIHSPAVCPSQLSCKSQPPTNPISSPPGPSLSPEKEAARSLLCLWTEGADRKIPRMTELALRGMGAFCQRLSD